MPALGGLLNGGANVCFANSVLQVVLRLPAVAFWLSHHAGACGAERHCTTCELWLARLALGKLPAVRPLLVEQLGRFGLYAFAGGAQQSAADFLPALLGQLRVCEVKAGRFVQWPGVACEVTHVERLFGFVLEKRCGVRIATSLLRRGAPTARTASCICRCLARRGARVCGHDGVVLPSVRCIVCGLRLRIV